MLEKKDIKFPDDNSKHDTVGEWWYFNGNLRSANGREFSYMNTLFRMALPFPRDMISAKIPRRNFYFYHSIITDVAKDRFFPNVDYIVRTTSDSFKRDGLSVYFSPTPSLKNFRCYYMEQTSANDYRLKGEGISLELVSKKVPLLEGGDGYVNFFDRPTFYYSLTNLQTKGSIVVDGESIEVSGKSWMDHQWSDVFDVTKDFWNWFSIQLDNGVEMVCYEYGHNGRVACIATVIYQDGRQEVYDEIMIKPLGKKWTSAKTKSIYDLAWEIKIPKADIDLGIESKVTNHEMNFLNVNYWESPIKVNAIVGGRATRGFGYMELAGRPSVFNDLNYLKEKVLERVKKAVK